MLASITESTCKQYNGALREWRDFCQKSRKDPFHASVTLLIEFLTDKFRSNASYGTLNTARSVIALIVPENISKDPLITRFFKGVSKLKPSVPKYETTWDTSIVLNYVQNMPPQEKLDLQTLSKKTVTLLALVSAHRAQTLGLIKTTNVLVLADSIEIKVPDRIKTTKIGGYQPLICIPFFKENPKLCVASALLYYTDRTKLLRGNESNLFITIKKPHKAVSSQTISRWIKGFLGDCGIDTKIFTAHSTRHASTSTAFKSGVDLDTIRKTAGWSENSTMFAKVYNRPITNTKFMFATSILKQNPTQ